MSELTVKQWLRLFSTSINELDKPDEELNELLQLPGAWYGLCTYHFGYQPTSAEDAQSIFFSKWHALAAEKLSEELSPLLNSYRNASEQGNKGICIKVAKLMAERFYSLGHLLLANSYIDLSMNENRENLSHALFNRSLLQFTLVMKLEKYSLEYLNELKIDVNDHAQRLQRLYHQCGYTMTDDLECSITAEADEFMENHEKHRPAMTMNR